MVIHAISQSSLFLPSMRRRYWAHRASGLGNGRTGTNSL
nr:MAG TPA_asm: hypothetical protein [Caudoviricetes sp.]DAL69067.1 MAG TPA: hypothetical protein [Caudoviricetes sp.]DAL72879.1 MAG TPA: hypothetical protein [Caudoviricetes sp.]